MRPSSRALFLAIATLLLGTCNLPTLPRAYSGQEARPFSQEVSPASSGQDSTPGNAAFGLVAKYQQFQRRTSAWVPSVDNEAFAGDVERFLSEHRKFLGAGKKRNIPMALLTTAAAPLVVRALDGVLHLDERKVGKAVVSLAAAYVLMEASHRAIPFGLSRDDPEICPLDSGTKRPIKSECREHRGPAVVMCHDRAGSLRTIDFMGFCDESGNCNHPEAFGGGELWRMEAVSGKWKYRDSRGSESALTCSDAWESEKHVEGITEPDEDFFRAFDGAPSFFLHARQERIIQGPRFSNIRSAVFSVNHPGLTKPDLDRDQATRWTNAGLLMLGYAEAVGFASNRLDVMREKVFKYAYAASHRERAPQ